MENNTLILTATIDSGESLSSVIDMSAFSINKDNYRIHGIVMPEDWTSADITFQASIDNGLSFKDMYDVSGSELKVVSVANTYIALIPDALSSVSFVKLRSGTSASPVNQLADRTIAVVLRGI